jgi:protein-disulfide isomerase
MRKQHNALRAEETPKTAGTQRMPAVTIAVLAALLALSYFNGRSAQQRATDLAVRLDQIDSRLAKLAANVEKVATRSSAPVQRGPDPNHVYAVKIAGAPVEGPLTAAVTIAEFSDFQ